MSRGKEKAKANNWRRFLQVRLRTLLVAVFLVAVVLSVRTAVHKYRLARGPIARHVVVLHAKAMGGSINRYFPAIVIESNKSKSILVSAAWGAEPFPIRPNPIPIESITVKDSGEPVTIVAYDTKLGVGLFSIQKPLPPLPPELIDQSIDVNVEIQSTDGSPESQRLHNVVAVGRVLPYWQADFTTVPVAGTFVFDRDTSGCPGTLLLINGKLAGIFLNNELSSPIRHHALPAKLLVERYRKLKNSSAATLSKTIRQQYAH